MSFSTSVPATWTTPLLPTHTAASQMELDTSAAVVSAADANDSPPRHEVALNAGAADSGSSDDVDDSSSAGCCGCDAASSTVVPPNVNAAGLKYRLPFKAPSGWLLLGQFVLGALMLVSPLYALFLASFVRYVSNREGNPLTTFFTIYYVATYLFLCFALIGRISRTHIYTRLLQHGFLIKFRSSATKGNIFMLVYLASLGLSTFIATAYFSGAALTAADKSSLVQSMLLHTGQLMAFYYTNIWYCMFANTADSVHFWAFVFNEAFFLALFFN
jgi:hypothetical protein